MLVVNERENIAALHLPSVDWSRYRDANPVPTIPLANNLATAPSRPVKLTNILSLKCIAQWEIKTLMSFKLSKNIKQLWHSHEVDIMFYGAKKTHIDRGRRPRLIFVFCAP